LRIIWNPKIVSEIAMPIVPRRLDEEIVQDIEEVTTFKSYLRPEISHNTTILES